MIVTVSGVATNGSGFTVSGVPVITGLSPSVRNDWDFRYNFRNKFWSCSKHKHNRAEQQQCCGGELERHQHRCHRAVGGIIWAFSVTVDGQTANSSSFSVSSIPSGWSDSDVGTVGLAGSAAYSNGVFTVKGAGTAIGSTADGMNFMYQTLAGDGSIIARVANLQGASYPQAGVMIRETLNAGATDAFIYFYPNQAYFLTRTTTGGSTNTQPAGFSSPASPYWCKVVRSGSTFEARHF